MEKSLGSAAQKLKSCFVEDKGHEDDLGEGDPNIWYKDLEIHAYGTLSLAAVKANLEMEDYGQVEIGHNATFIGVYDGHGGTETSKFLSQHLFPNFIRAANQDGFIKATTLESAVETTKNEFVDYVGQKFLETPEISAAGSCCLAAVIWRENLIIANLGDSRAVMGVTDKEKDLDLFPDPITQDHNVSRAEVRQEVLDDNPGDTHILVQDPADGTWRIRGVSQVYRTIGDQCLKSTDFALGPPRFPRFHLDPPLTRSALRSDAVVSTRHLSWKDQFIVFGSRGLWEHLTNEKVIETVFEHPGNEAVARRLLREAMNAAAKKANTSYRSLRATPSGDERRAIHDDITVIVVFIDKSTINSVTSSNIKWEDQQSIQSCTLSTGPSHFMGLHENIVPPVIRYSELRCRVLISGRFNRVDRIS